MVGQGTGMQRTLSLAQALHGMSFRPQQAATANLKLKADNFHWLKMEVVRIEYRHYPMYMQSGVGAVP
jgi:hypothetical protein